MTTGCHPKKIPLTILLKLQVDTIGPWPEYVENVFIQTTLSIVNKRSVGLNVVFICNSLLKMWKYVRYYYQTNNW